MREMNRPYSRVVVGFGAILLAVVLFSAWGQSSPADPVAGNGVTDYELSRSTIDGGGGMFSSGGNYELSGTIGQPDAGALANGDYELTGGFWFPQAPGDCNVDGGVNLFDFDLLADCATGPNGALLAECVCFDLDRDGDVDLYDFAEFQTGFSGS